MILTVEKLKELNACEEGLKWFEYQNETELREVCYLLLDYNYFGYARWLLPRLMTHRQCVQWAVYCAEKVLHVFEDRYPDDKRPRLAIEAAKNWLDCHTTTTCVAAAHAAAHAADAAYNAAYYAATAACVTANVAYYAAADATASTTAYAATVAAYATDAADAAYSAADTYAAAASKFRREIIDYGLELIEGDNLSVVETILLTGKRRNDE